MPPYRGFIDTVLQRLRDPQGTTHARSHVLTTMVHAERVVNAALGLVLRTTTLSTQASRIFYSVTAELPTSMKIRGVRDVERNLDFLPSWMDLWFTHREWHRTQSGMLRAYGLAGRDVLVLWPSRDRDGTVDVVHSLMIPLPATEDEAVTLPDHAMPCVMDLTELLLAVKGRNYPPVDPAMDSIKKRIQALA